MSWMSNISERVSGDPDFLRLEHPEYLWLLLLIPALIFLSFFVRKVLKSRLYDFYNAENVKYIVPGISNSNWWLRTLLWSMVFALFVVAAANFQVGAEKGEVDQEGVDVMFCLDVSTSMMAEDIAPNRLERAKHSIKKTVEELGSDRVGIVVFAGDAYVQLPLTTDHAATKMYLDNITTDIIPVQGTSIANAIEKAMQAFPKEKKDNRAIALITDGENHDERAIDLAKEAASRGIKVYTVGIGSVQGATIPEYINGKKVGLKKDNKGSTVVSRINEQLLIDISDAGEGAYVRSTNESVGLNKLFLEIKGMNKALVGVSVFNRYNSYYHVTLIMGMILLILNQTLIERKW